MQKDSDCMKSGVYYKDPGTKELLTGSEERATQCCISDAGKFIWPQVKFSDGSVGKILYSLWTSEEKEIYKQYRSGGTAKKQQASVKPDEVHVQLAKATVHQYEDVTHSQVSVPSGSILEYISKCTEHLGVWIFENRAYDLLAVKGTNSYMPVPRVLIPAADMQRLKIV